MNASKSLIAAEGITVERAGRRLIDQVDLEVCSGEIVTLIGPNGAGKTTLVRVLLGILEPDAGRVTRRERLRVGYVPQRHAVDPVLPITVERFLALGGRGVRGERQSVLAATGIAGLRRSMMHELSGGELQRTMLARALLREPDILILDEPAQGVDVSGQLDLYRLIARLRDERGCGVLLVSHDLHLVMRATDRVYCLNQHMCCAGRPEAVSRHPEYLQLFGPRASELAVYSHHHDHDHDLAGHVVHDHDHGHGPEDGGHA